MKGRLSLVSEYKGRKGTGVVRPLDRLPAESVVVCNGCLVVCNESLQVVNTLYIHRYNTKSVYNRLCIYRYNTQSVFEINYISTINKFKK